MTPDQLTQSVGSPNRRERASDLRTVCAARLILALISFLIINIDPTNPDRLVGLTYTALALYTLYSAVIYFLSINHSHMLPLKMLHWFDLAWYVVLIAFSSGTDSAFFFFCFFAILVASFTQGFKSGISVTIASAVLLMIVGYVARPVQTEFALNRFLLRPLCLLVLGYLIAYWSDREIRLRRRLQFLKDITNVSNPRLGVDRTLNLILEELRSLYWADSCLMIRPRRADPGGSCRLHRVTSKGHQPIVTSQLIAAETGRIFRWPLSNVAVIYRKTRWSTKTLFYDIKTEQFSKYSPSTIDQTAYILETNAFLSVPVSYPDGLQGRLYLVGGQHRFGQSDIDFVLQLIDHVAPLLENIRLVDNLAAEAAEQELRRIANDIHDSVIQPYVGLQFGLTAVRQKLESGNNAVLQDVSELLDLTKGELSDLRNYVHGLRAGEQRQEILVPALERFAARFSAVTGIDVEVEAKVEIPADRLAGELFQLVVEGLSNVRRHTRSNRARISIDCQDGDIKLEIKNNRPRAGGNLADGNNGKRDGDVSFTPRSISERAASLGGETRVYTDDEEYTVVSVSIPL